jgi:HD-like signal output (HDOD) protein/ActR/RegA family two-component response regulator
MKKRIIFVDDKPGALEDLRRRLHVMSAEWDMAFALDGCEALKFLQREPFQVLVTDISMTGMDGSELLHCVKDLHPQVLRIVLSGEGPDRATVLKSVGLAHQYLSKASDPVILKRTIERAWAMRGLLEDESLIDVISGMESLPSLHSLYMEVLNEANSPSCSLDRVGEIISKDVGMSAKILQLVNSAFFGHPKQITTLVKAVFFLGMETIKALILSTKIFSRFDRSGLPGFSISKLWDHSIATGIIARSIATQKDLTQSNIDEAFMAGLLHDVGKLILLDRLREKCIEIARVQKSTDCRIWEAEQEILGTTHAQVGAYLMGIWGLSESIVESIAYHHRPSMCPNQAFNTLTAVHLADSLEHSENAGANGDRLDHEYLDRLRIDPESASGRVIQGSLR